MADNESEKKKESLHSFFSRIGKKGGQAKTPEKVEASRTNGQLGGRPKESK